jgi:hypothetical protein
MPRLLVEGVAHPDGIRERYAGHIFPPGIQAGLSPWTFLDMFQFDHETMRMKGIIDLESQLADYEARSGTLSKAA